MLERLQLGDNPDLSRRAAFGLFEANRWLLFPSLLIGPVQKLLQMDHLLVHVAQTPDQHAHDMNCEKRILLNEELESPRIDARQLAIGLGDKSHIIGRVEVYSSYNPVPAVCRLSHG